MSTSRQLERQVAIVTGGGRGIGRAIAVALSEQGASVAVAARTQDEIEVVRRTVEQGGGRAIAVQTDVTNERAVAELVDAVEQHLGAPTLLVNNAGVWRHVGPIEDADPAEWWYDVEVSLKGAFLCTRAVLPRMLAQRAGRIINISSYAAIAPRPFATSYAAAKAGVLAFTGGLALELDRRGVLIFAVTPGFVRTRLIENVVTSAAGRRFLPELAERTDALAPDEAGRLVADIATGRLDQLAGRFLHVRDDVDDLLERVSELERGALHAADAVPWPPSR